MDKGGGSDIPQIDPAALVAQQQQANRISQFTPQGNLIFGNVDAAGKFQPGTGQAASVLEESPFQQRHRMGGEDLALLAQNLAAPRIANLPAAPIDTTKLPAFKSGIDWSRVGAVPSAADFSADSGRLEQATFDRALGLLNPLMEKQSRALDVTLANRGIPLGSEAHTGALADLRRAHGEALNKAALDAVTAGRTEQGRLFGQALAGHQAGLGDQTTEAGLVNAARAQQVQEQQALRTGNLQEIAAMLGINPVTPVEAKGFFAPTPVDVTGPYGLSQNAAIANQQLQQQNQNAFLSGLFDLGSAAATAGIKYSDRRLKTDVKRVGTTDRDRLPIYRYRMKGGPVELGVMAQDVETVRPEAVRRNPLGMMAVDYAQVQ